MECWMDCDHQHAGGHLQQDMDKILFRHWDPIGPVEGIIQSWEPGPLDKEREYSESLAACLRGALPTGLAVVREYGVGNGVADICIDDRVFIEVKNNLVRPGTLDRLLGQLARYKRTGKRVIVVLVGDVRSDLREELNAWVEENQDGFLMDDFLRVVDKAHGS
jgi:hypothetical protein